MSCTYLQSTAETSARGAIGAAATSGNRASTSPPFPPGIRVVPPVDLFEQAARLADALEAGTLERIEIPLPLVA